MWFSYPLYTVGKWGTALGHQQWGGSTFVHALSPQHHPLLCLPRGKALLNLHTLGTVIHFSTLEFELRPLGFFPTKTQNLIIDISLTGLTACSLGWLLTVGPQFEISAVASDGLFMFQLLFKISLTPISHPHSLPLCLTSSVLSSNATPPGSSWWYWHTRDSGLEV